MILNMLRIDSAMISGVMQHLRAKPGHGGDERKRGLELSLVLHLAASVAI